MWIWDAPKHLQVIDVSLELAPHLSGVLHLMLLLFIRQQVRRYTT